MFSERPDLYDHFYGHKDYAAEAAHVADLVQSLRPGAGTLLDVACGTGRHLEHLSGRFACEGVDLEEGLLAIARQRLPDVRFTSADMVDFDLGRRFDAVVCLFSSIGYVLTIDRLDRAIASMARHLAPGGVLLVEPWILRENWEDPGHVLVTHVEEGPRNLLRVASSVRDGQTSVLHMHYVVAEPGSVETADEIHHLGLFSQEEYMTALSAAGLATQWYPVGLIGRGLLAGVAPS